MGVQAVGAERTVARPDIRVFELPVQPLGTALESFARITNREILYEGRLTEHRRSAEVRGVYAADVALDDAKRRNGDARSGRRGATPIGYDPNSKFQVIGNGELTEAQKKKLTDSEPEGL